MPIGILCVVAAALAFGAAGEASHEIVLTERQTIAMVVLWPRGRPGSTDPSAIWTAASRALEARTDLKLLSPEQAGWDADLAQSCGVEHRLSCWVRSVRPAPGVQPVYLLVLGLIASDEARATATAILIDLERAKKDTDEAPKGEAGWEEKLEDRIFQDSVRAEPGAFGLRDENALKEYFERTFARDFRPVFERRSHFDPYGTIEIDPGGADLQIDLDGRPIGATNGKLTRILNVSARRRAIALIDPSGKVARRELTVDVRRGQAALVSAHSLSRDEDSAERSLIFWSSASAAALGAAIVAVSALAPRRTEYLVACRGTACGRSVQSSFASLCDISPSDASCFDHRALPLAPLGLGIAAAGSISLGGSALESGSDPIWLPPAIGLAAGVLVFVLGVILNPDPRIRQ